jgi:2-polyprenyl-6-methoxyphenol hydroxylase-like FAD-dependent oxidoreductase
MTSIGIVGSGIAGLQLGLFLQQAGVSATIYSDRTPDQIRAGRLPNSVARFEHTQARERELGVNFWEFPDFQISSLHFRINDDPPLAFRGDIPWSMSFVDMRIYLAALLDAFAARGGEVIIGTLQAADLAGLAARHDLITVASGRASLTELFPRDAERSPYDQPQRRLCCGIFRGVRHPEPLGASYNVSPGHGEIFQAPFYTFEGWLNTLLFECIPGQGLAQIVDLRYEDDPKAFEMTVLDLLREHAPVVYERVDQQHFGLTRPLDLLQGAITPTVRRGYAALDGGRYVVALGDVHVLNDPILGQGANAASQAAWVLGEAIVAGGPFDEAFCHRVEDRIWAYASAVTAWTNATLQPPPDHAVEVFVAAAQNQAIANTLVDNFNAPARNWAVFKSPEGAADFIASFGPRQDGASSS